MKKITPFLWFEDKAEDAVRFYTSIFPNSRIEKTTRYTQESAEKTDKAIGSTMSIAFQLNGQEFVALNGGTMFQFSPATSFVINCDSQEEIDHYWKKLTDGGEPMMCGWVTDRYGVTWQVVPIVLTELLESGDTEAARRVTNAFMEMKKFDIETLVRAFEGE